jgi:UrcA family protein
MNRLIASALAALALAGMAAPSALAEKRTVSMTISYADLDLASPAGAKSMLNRLQKASRKVCGTSTHRSPEEMTWAKACMTDAMSSAVSRLNAPTVSALFMDPQRPVYASR